MDALIWRRSSRCDAGTCVEVAQDGDTVHVRDAKDEGDGPVLTFTREEFEAFRLGIIDGDFCFWE